MSSLHSSVYFPNRLHAYVCECSFVIQLICAAWASMAVMKQLLISLFAFSFLIMFFFSSYRIRSNSRSCPISAHPFYFEVKNHKIITLHLPRSIHRACILSSMCQGISLKMAKIIHFWVDLCNKYWNKYPPRMIYLSTLGTYWNECGTCSSLPTVQLGLLVFDEKLDVYRNPPAHSCIWPSVDDAITAVYQRGIQP